VSACVRSHYILGFEVFGYFTHWFIAFERSLEKLFERVARVLIGWCKINYYLFLFCFVSFFFLFIVFFFVCLGPILLRHFSELRFRGDRTTPPESICSRPCNASQAKKYVEGEGCCWTCVECVLYQVKYRTLLSIPNNICPFCVCVLLSNRMLL
jgi:hypothetical protein